MRRIGQRPRPLHLVVACVVGLALGACASTPETGGRAEYANRPVRAVDFDFEHQAADLGSIVPSVSNEGTARVSTSIATGSGGRAILDDGVDGGYGLRFPAFDDAGNGTGAAVVVRSAGAPDVLSPGRQDFRFGADFALDRLSAGTVADNGDNLVQRGLTADLDQYKIQLDHDVPSCRVAGTEGVAFVESDVTVVPERWYRVSCLRRVDRVELTVVPWEGEHWGTAKVTTVFARTGSVDFESSDALLSIGAKVSPDGKLITSASDQFNGVADNVHFEVVR